MTIYLTNPLSDQRWDTLVSSHAVASAFHQRGWLEALSRTYGYQPLVLTSAAPGEPMRNGIVLCRVSSWITGTRVVSLPFADHCELLLDDSQSLPEFLGRLRSERDCQHWKYVELRPRSGIRNMSGEEPPSRSYFFHELDLTPSLEQIFCNFHKDSIQRRIRHAERERLSYAIGRSLDLVDEFYRLLLVTRKRHGLLPQPYAWFKNLAECMKDNLQIRLAKKDGASFAAVLTLRHRNSLIYKYGCSDEKRHNLAGMPFLFWRLIQESKASGIDKIDFGRSDLDQESLVRFKDRFGTNKSLLNYYRYPTTMRAPARDWGVRRIRQFFSILPESVSATAGRLVYRHIG